MLTREQLLELLHGSADTAFDRSMRGSSPSLARGQGTTVRITL